VQRRGSSGIEGPIERGTCLEQTRDDVGSAVGGCFGERVLEVVGEGELAVAATSWKRSIELGVVLDQELDDLEVRLVSLLVGRGAREDT